MTAEMPNQSENKPQPSSAAFPRLPARRRQVGRKRAGEKMVLPRHLRRELEIAVDFSGLKRHWWYD
jgi:hypothetical protein